METQKEAKAGTLILKCTGMLEPRSPMLN